MVGSFQAKEDHIDDSIGLKSGMPSYNPLWFNHKPLSGFISRFFPQPQNIRLIDLPENFIGFCGVLLFVVAIYYVNLHGRTTAFIEWSFFSWILLATFFIGGMSDKKFWGLVGWIIFCFAFPIYSLTLLEQSDWILYSCFGLLIMSAFKGCSYLWYKRISA